MAKQLLFNESAGGGGGGLDNGTTLWQNAASLAEFSGQDVTLSLPITDFDFVGFRYIIKDGYDDNTVYEAIWRSSDVIKTGVGSGNQYKPQVTITGSAAGYLYMRYIYQKNDTTLNISRSTRDGATFTTSIIPIEIVGY